MALKNQDFWTITNKEKGAKNEDLAQWVSLALKTAMTLANIRKWFSSIYIWPWNRTTMHDGMKPNKVIINVPDVINEEEIDNEHVEEVPKENITWIQRGGIQYIVTLTLLEEWIPV